MSTTTKNSQSSSAVLMQDPGLDEARLGRALEEGCALPSPAASGVSAGVIDGPPAGLLPGRVGRLLTLLPERREVTLATRHPPLPVFDGAAGGEPLVDDRRSRGWRTRRGWGHLDSPRP
jgi:hypothetical protein